MPDVAADLALARRLAGLADEITLRRFRALDLVVETKPDLTPVSEADREVERVLRDALAAERPGDAVVGEEYGEQGTGSRRWIVDPIDGTKNYVRGVPVYATLLALEEDGIVTVGVVSAPALGRRWWAGRGLGAYAGAAGPAGTSGATGATGATASGDGTPIRVSRVSALADAHFSFSSLAGWEQQRRLDGLLDLTRACWRTRAFGDFWSHLLVAEGGVDIAAEPEVSLWDLAAIQVIVEEAGGRFTDLAGRATADGGSAVSSNGLLHDHALRFLAPR